MDSPELERAIRIKTNSNRGGLVENIYVRDITIGQVKEAVLKINCEYEVDDEGTGPYIPLIKNVFLDGISSRKSEYPVYLQGIKNETCIDTIIIRNSDFKGVMKNSYLEYTGYVNFKNVDIDMAGEK
ncbi:MAG TPA: glycosyl hydrolase family 28 protein, partial [Bacteroidales bacterium]|nr:glycosyl hydrolase family 28 protein [Bacteroidales bacterium]